MHIEATTRLAPGEVVEKLRACGRGADRAASGAPLLRCELDRQPPKVFVPAAPLGFPPAAELHLAARPQGSHVVLRLMWGPLPAPFPRAVAAAGLVLGGALVLLAPSSLPALVGGALLAGLPAAALWRQRAGEQQLRARLGALLGGCRWVPRPH